MTFRCMEATDTVEKFIRDEFVNLQQEEDHIMYCSVVVVPVPRQLHAHQLYDLRIDLVVPVQELVVRYRGPSRPSDDDFRAAVREAFEAARKQLRDVADNRSER